MREVRADEARAAGDQDWFRFSVLVAGRGSECFEGVAAIAISWSVRFSPCHNQPPFLSSEQCSATAFLKEESRVQESTRGSSCFRYVGVPRFDKCKYREEFVRKLLKERRFCRWLSMVGR